MGKFTWQAPVEGFRWERDTAQDPSDEIVADPGSEGTLYLVPANWQFREYEPLEEFSGLFRTFAQTSPTQEGILEFANKYGNLGDVFDVLERMQEPPEPPEECKTPEQRAEWMLEEDKKWRMIDPLGTWTRAIERMRPAVRLWDKAQAGEAGNLAIREVRAIVNDELGIDRVYVALEEDRKLGGLALQVKPRSLLAALWLQFARAVAGNKQYRACRTCGQPYELDPKIARKSRQYCSEACRSRAYRGRKERAQALAAEGKSPKEIAEELESDVKTVKGWLKPPRR
jgi:hypothetical protein